MKSSGDLMFITTFKVYFYNKKALRQKMSEGEKPRYHLNWPHKQSSLGDVTCPWRDPLLSCFAGQARECIFDGAYVFSQQPKTLWNTLDRFSFRHCLWHIQTIYDIIAYFFRFVKRKKAVFEGTCPNFEILRLYNPHKNPACRWNLFCPAAGGISLTYMTVYDNILVRRR